MLAAYFAHDAFLWKNLQTYCTSRDKIYTFQQVKLMCIIQTVIL